METSEKLKIALTAGEILLKSGAETARVENTIMHIIKNQDFTYHETFVTPTGIFISVENEDEGIVTVVKRVENISVNLEKIDAVNDVSRNIANGEMSMYEAQRRLEKINRFTLYPLLNRAIASGIACAGFSLMFAGTIKDVLSSGLIAILFAIFHNFAQNITLPKLLEKVFNGMLASSIAILFVVIGFAENADIVIRASILPLLPGLAFLNSIRDIAVGDFQSGVSRLADTLMVAAGLAVGVGFVLKIWWQFYGGLSVW